MDIRSRLETRLDELERAVARLEMRLLELAKHVERVDKAGQRHRMFGPGFEKYETD